MDIRIEQIIPVPLKENLSQRNSQIWLQNYLFEQGNFYHIKAPSGSGKSTFIHSLYGLRKDYEGNIFYDQENIKTITPEKLAAFRQTMVSIVFQDLRLFTSLTAKENILIKQSLQPYHPAEKITEFAHQLQIKHKLEQSSATLSYGERQRVAIIRALMQPFNWLLLDEPFSHLDQNNIQLAVKMIQAACDQRKAGLIIVDLEDDDHFSYSEKLWM